MFKQHLKALEIRLGDKAPLVKQIDLWNGQTAMWEKAKQITPAVFIDFGTVAWRDSNGVKQGRTTMKVHCVGISTRDTDHQANDSDGKRLERLDLCETVLKALERFSAKDADGRYILHQMMLVNTIIDTNHDSLYDDVLLFDCWLYYYGTWRNKQGTEIILQAVDVVNDQTI